MKPVDMSLTTHAGARVVSPVPPMCTLQRAGSHDGGLTS
jgi:hypothetical protein